MTDDAAREAMDHAAFRQLIYQLAPEDAEAYDDVIDATHAVIDHQHALAERVETLEARLDERDAVDEVIR